MKWTWVAAPAIAGLAILVAVTVTGTHHSDDEHSLGPIKATTADRKVDKVSTVEVAANIDEGRVALIDSAISNLKATLQEAEEKGDSAAVAQLNAKLSELEQQRQH